MKIGLLGGTFDPPHLGHLSVAKAVLKEGHVDKVWFLPCWKHAFGKITLPFAQRANMCSIMIYEEPNIEVCHLEEVIESTHSVKILSVIRQMHQNDKFNLIMGSDNYWKMDKWKDPEAVKRLAPPIWVHREGYKKPPAPEIVVECSFNASSTEIRRAIKYKDAPDVLKTKVDFAVLNYIQSKKLYELRT